MNLAAIIWSYITIYIKVRGKSIRRIEDVKYLVGQMEEAKQTIATRGLFATKEEREHILSIYEHGIETLVDR